MPLHSKKGSGHPFAYSPNPAPNPCCTWSAQKRTEKTLLVIWIRRRDEVQWLNWGKIYTWFLMSLRSLRKVHPMLFASPFLLWRLKLYFQKYAGLLWFLHKQTYSCTYTWMHIKGLAENMSQNLTGIIILSKFHCRSLRHHPSAFQEQDLMYKVNHKDSFCWGIRSPKLALCNT